MSEQLVIAAVALAVALVGLWPAARTGVLREVSRPPRQARAAPGWFTLASLRFGLVAGLTCWLLWGQGIAGAVAGILCVPLAMGLLAWLEAGPERRTLRSLTEQVPLCLDLLSSALDAGAPLQSAVRHACALVPEPSAALLGGVLRHLDVGRCEAEAWTTLREHRVWGPMARDLARSADSGAAVADLLRVHAAEARARRNAQQEASARTIGVRSVLPLVCCFLPAFILVGVVPIIAATLSSLTQPR